MKRSSLPFFLLFILVIVGMIVLKGLTKYLPILLHQTIIYCREIIAAPQTIINSPTTFLPFLVALGVVSSLGYFLLQVLKEIYFVRRMTKEIIVAPSRVLKASLKLGIQDDDVRVFRHQQHEAFCYGVFRPKIYMSSGLIRLLSPAELETVLEHEHHHLKQNDNLTLGLSHLLVYTFPFFPLFSDLHNFIKQRQELAADYHATNGRLQPYTLLSVFKKLLIGEKTPTYLFTASIRESTTLENRIRALKKEPLLTTKPALRRVLTTILTIIVLGVLLKLPVNATEIHYKGNDTLLVCLNEKSCAQQCIKSFNQVNTSMKQEAPLFSSTTHSKMILDK